MRVLVEVCVDDVAGALAAEVGGADRVELCADLGRGGTTPSAGMVRAVLAAVTRVGVQVMVRPRGGDFAYSRAELDVMLADVAHLRAAAAGARVPVGVVTGVLTTDGSLDVAAMRRLVEAAAPLPVTAHKAVDETPDLERTYDALRDLGVVRVLTSGGAATAAEGATTLARLVERSRAGGPAVLAGGAVRPGTVAALVAGTGVGEVHLRAQAPSDRGDGTLDTDVDVVRALVAAVGRPAPTPRAAPAPDAWAVLAVDAGGTAFKASLVDDRGRVVVRRDARSGDSGEASYRHLADLLLALRREATDRGLVVLGAGVATPGMVDEPAGVVRYASTLRWSDLPLGPRLADELGLPVAVGHDVRSAGLAESLFGAAAGEGDAVLVSIGTGVAASILTGGHAVTGAQTTAGELGHIPVVEDGEPCTCGQRGCLEVYCSGAGLARRYAAAGGLPGLDAAAVVARLDEDPVAAGVWDDAVRALAQGLATVTLLLDPRVVVLTGGFSRAGDRLLEPLRTRLAGLLAWRDAPPVRLSPLGTEAGRIGAAVLGLRAAGRDDVVERWRVADLLG
ncbi:copper homeostasis protein CutC [Lapillicoccus jejuensis]|uniref:PF03932 family protein CutC n=1 Tax=Lapillicoccus jejuensis TaxID=402171 RepID=A0A542DXC0_9MICO|nr:copper homeostasis protein CutC [Lapillicoccus jejuensis]